MTVATATSMLFIAMATVGVAMAGQVAVPRCRTLKPSFADLAERAVFKTARKSSSPYLRASVKASVSAETQLDVVDVLVAYDLSAQKWLVSNTKSSPVAYAQHKVDEMNECLLNSRISEFKFRLVGTVCIGVDATRYRDNYGYVDLERILSDLLVDEGGNVVATGEWAKITTQREALGADVVSLLVDAGRYGIVGLGYSLEDAYGWYFSADSSLIPSFGDWAYSVCSISVADDDYSMLHEIGHNMGCGHPDRTCASSYAMYLGPQLYNYSAGYYPWIGGKGYYTIMGYNFGGLGQDGLYDSEDRFTALPYFSSPLLSYNGETLGSDYNDNRRTLINTYAYVSQYRPSVLAPDAEPTIDPGVSPLSRAFPTEFNPTSVINGKEPYVGAVYDGGKPVAIVSLKCGKTAVKGKRMGMSKVAAYVTGLDGKKKSAKAVYVTSGYDAKATLEVKDWGTLNLTLGGEGFVGTLGSGLTVRTASVCSAWPHKKSAVDVDFSNGTGALPEGTLEDLLPTGEKAEPFSLNGGKWTFAKAAPIKYKKIKDKVTNESHYELQGTDDPLKTNLSAMKLNYTPKKGTFKGSFKVYSLEQSGTNAKLKKYSAKASGIVVDGVGYGTAVINKVGTYPLSVAQQD